MMVTPLTLRSRKAGDTFTGRVNGICASIASQSTVRRMVRQSKSGALYARPVCHGEPSCIITESTPRAWCAQCGGAMPAGKRRGAKFCSLACNRRNVRPNIPAQPAQGWPLP